MASHVGSDNRGTDRLLWDCETVGLATADRIPADERLRDEVGEDLAGLLLAGLTSDEASAKDEPPAESGRAA